MRYKFIELEIANVKSKRAAETEEKDRKIALL